MLSSPISVENLGLGRNMRSAESRSATEARCLGFRLTEFLLSGVQKRRLIFRYAPRSSYFVPIGRECSRSAANPTVSRSYCGR